MATSHSVSDCLPHEHRLFDWGSLMRLVSAFILYTALPMPTDWQQTYILTIRVSIVPQIGGDDAKACAWVWPCTSLVISFRSRSRQAGFT